MGPGFDPYHQLGYTGELLCLTAASACAISAHHLIAVLVTISIRHCLGESDIQLSHLSVKQLRYSNNDDWSQISNHLLILTNM